MPAFRLLSGLDQLRSARATRSTPLEPWPLDIVPLRLVPIPELLVPGLVLPEPELFDIEPVLLGIVPELLEVVFPEEPELLVLPEVLGVFIVPEGPEGPEVPGVFIVPEVPELLEPPMPPVLPGVVEPSGLPAFVPDELPDVPEPGLVCEPEVDCA